MNLRATIYYNVPSLITIEFTFHIFHRNLSLHIFFMILIAAFITKIIEHKESAINYTDYVKALHIDDIVYINP